MSRIGKLPVNIPEGVEVSVNKGNVVVVKGKMGELTQKVAPEIEVKVEDNQVILNRHTEAKYHKSLHGLYRALINNMVTGVSQGFEKKLTLKGVGFRAEANGQVLELGLGYSHPIVFQLPDEIQVEAKTERRADPVVTLRSADKQLLGQVASKIRSFRLPEPYKGKGILYEGEQIRRKAGKAAASS